MWRYRGHGQFVIKWSFNKMKSEYDNTMKFYHPLNAFQPLSCTSGAILSIFEQGWSSAYSLESVILQIAATLVKGKARIQFGASKVKHYCFKTPPCWINLMNDLSPLKGSIQFGPSTAVLQILGANSWEKWWDCFLNDRALFLIPCKFYIPLISSRMVHSTQRGRLAVLASLSFPPRNGFHYFSFFL